MLPLPAAGNSNPERKPYMTTQTRINHISTEKLSAAEWFRGIPAHWALTRLKFCAINVADLTGHRDADDIYVALENVESGSGKMTEPDDETIFESQAKRFQTGDVLFGKLRPYLAKVTQAQRPGVCVGECRCPGILSV